MKPVEDTPASFWTVFWDVAGTAFLSIAVLALALAAMLMTGR